MIFFSKPGIVEITAIPGFSVKVFFSYSRQNKLLAKRMVESLCPYHDIWVDWEDIAAGEEWKYSIAKGIRQCDVFIFLVSQYSIDSEYCQKETQLALRHKKKIIPVVLEEGLPLERELAEKQWVFLDENIASSFDTAIRSLLNAMKPKPSHHWVWVALVEAVIIGVLIFSK